MTPPRVVVVGLGPAGADLVLPAARRALEGRVCFARTGRHPAVSELGAEGVTFETFDAVYDTAGSLDDVYRTIVDRLVATAGEHGEVVYAVPGSPIVAERTVGLLLGADVEVELVPGISFADLAWTRLGVDPLGGVRIVDGRSIGEVAVTGPVLIAQCDTPVVLSDVKLSLLERFRPETPVVVLQRLGLPDETVDTVPLGDLDRAVTPDHLTSVYVDGGPDASDEFARFVALIERLRGPGGCPWDAEQTHHTLTRHLVEEAYEVVEALEGLPPDAPGGPTPVPAGAYEKVEEELGDLAAQVVFHATLAREAGAFTIADVLAGIREKLVRRHPHVFGDVAVEGADDVMRNWEQIKKEEKGAVSLMDDVPSHLPGLLYAHKLFRKAESGGLDVMGAGDAATALAEVAGRLGPDPEPAVAEALVGEALAVTVLYARARGFDAESALRGWTRRFRDRFVAMESLAAERGVDLEGAEPATVAALWIEAGLSGPGLLGTSEPA